MFRREFDPDGADTCGGGTIMDQKETDELRNLTNTLNKHDAKVVGRLDSLTEEIHNMSFRTHNDLQILMGVLYIEERHAKNGATVKTIQRITDTVSNILEQYDNPIGVIRTTETRIVIVEDEPSISKYIELVMVDLGYRVVGKTGRADTAVVLVAEQDPDIVLMDIALEDDASGIDASGIDAACEIRDRTGTPVIFVTGCTDASLIEESKRADPEGYLIKPFGVNQIYATIELALARRKKEDEEITPLR